MKCEKCGFTTEFKGALTNHIKFCGNIPKHKAKPTCDICRRKIPHSGSHTCNPAEMICDKCGKEFISIAGKKAHVRFCGTKPPKPTEFPCERCKRVFTTKRGLTLHTSMRKTPCDQEYKCFHCDFKTLNCNEMFWHSRCCEGVGSLIEL